jgi:hypothetical protein
MSVDHYNIYLDDTLVHSVAAPLTQDALHGLPPGSLHLVSVSAVDAAGNESARSSLASFIVTPTVEVPPPQLAVGRIFADPLEVESPQIGYPYRFTKDGFDLDESDTQGEYVSIVWFTSRTPIGSRPESPDHGTADLFGQLNPGVALQAAIDQADERISALVGSERDALDEAIVRLEALVAPPGVDQ